MSATGMLFTDGAFRRSDSTLPSPPRRSRSKSRSKSHTKVRSRCRREQFEERRRSLRRALRFETLAVVDELAALGFAGNNVAVLELIPVLQVAWADGHISHRARKLILEMASELALKDSAMRRLELHLKFKAEESFFRRTVAVLAQIYGLCPPAGAARAKVTLRQRMRLVSRQGGGVFGFVTGLFSGSARRTLLQIEESLGFCVAPQSKGVSVVPPTKEALPFLQNVELLPVEYVAPTVRLSREGTLAEGFGM